MNSKYTYKSSYLLFTALFIALLPWLYIQSQLILNGNVTFLLRSALYLISGQRMSEYYYDTNPPLSILIYSAPALLVKYMGLSHASSILIWSLSILLLCSRILYCAAQSLYNRLTCDLITSVYLITNTITLCLFFGEKEFFIIVTLLPFILIQMAITKKKEDQIPGFIKHVGLILGAFYLMVKPHYYILPAAAILYRFITQKRLTIVFDKDCLYICIFAMTYLTIVFYSFPDFLSIILPDILQFYVQNPAEMSIRNTLYALVGGAFFVLIAYLITPETQKRTNLFFGFFMLAIIAYHIQGMGFHYHLVPAVVLFMIGCSLLIFDFIENALNALKINHNTASLITIFIINAMLLSVSYGAYTSDETLTHKQFSKLPLTQDIMQHCTQKPCSYFMLNDSLEISQQLSTYTGQAHASRFPTFWFLPKLVSETEPDEIHEGREEIFKKYSSMITEDFMRFKPHSLFILRLDINEQNKDFDLIKFLSKHEPKFAEIMNNYIFEQTMTINQFDYLQTKKFAGDTLKYDVYRLKTQD